MTPPGAHWVRALLLNDVHTQWERKEEAIAGSHCVFQAKTWKKSLDMTRQHSETIHWRSSHKLRNINSSCIALIQFAGKVNLAHNIPLFSQCLRNFPLASLVSVSGPFDLHISQTWSHPQMSCPNHCNSRQLRHGTQNRTQHPWTEPLEL